ncbi:endonuclease/exonuclease/phosphatase family protein [Mucilaginibacter glaciei]|uniref:Endonuclease/exonuclease/phosphatase family protein n=1 Tax=Mucilaginibacter glaciei TaxID=2772109 RepID=A0A926S2M1_9SPHI|nr:endonuclease/exonuclease/phosphatase family protein [Mucilaginibacter glaciei]MBD1394002.1 endonuclease/exonuclease/phosphatase family protein [Mucilaginibacter glaciei]
MRAKKKGLNFFEKLLLYFNVMLCVALLLSYIAGYVDPRKFWLIAFFGLAYPPLLLFSGIMAVYWLLRKSLYALLSIITIAVGYNVLASNIGMRLPADSDNTANKNTLTLMTYNVHSFKVYGLNNTLATKHDFLELIKDQNPDIIGMQEFYTRRRGQYNMIDSVKRIMNSNEYYYEPFDAVPDESSGMAIFSKYKIIGHGWVKFNSGSGNQCIYVDVEKNGSKFRMYSVHLQSIHFEPEDYKYLGDVSKKGPTDMNATKRLGSKLKNAFIKRAEQVFIVKNHAKTCPYPYTISGDFNDTPASFAVTQMAKGMKNAFREKGAGLGRTYNGDFPNYQIDFVMVSPQIKVNDYRIIEKKLSDHYPLKTELVLN